MHTWPSFLAQKRTKTAKDDESLTHTLTKPEKRGRNQFDKHTHSPNLASSATKFSNRFVWTFLRCTLLLSIIVAQRSAIAFWADISSDEEEKDDSNKRVDWREKNWVKNVKTCNGRNLVLKHRERSKNWEGKRRETSLKWSTGDRFDWWSGKSGTHTHTCTYTRFVECLNNNLNSTVLRRLTSSICGHTSWLCLVSLPLCLPVVPFWGSSKKILAILCSRCHTHGPWALNWYLHDFFRLLKLLFDQKKPKTKNGQKWHTNRQSLTSQTSETEKNKACNKSNFNQSVNQLIDKNRETKVVAD